MIGLELAAVLACGLPLLGAVGNGVNALAAGRLYGPTTVSRVAVAGGLVPSDDGAPEPAAASLRTRRIIPEPRALRKIWRAAATAIAHGERRSARE